MFDLPLSARDRVAAVAALLPLFVYGIAGDYEHPDLPHLGTLLAATICFAGVMAGRSWAAYAALACALAVGFHERALNHPFNGNDVMLATDEALRVLQGGGNPYDHSYTATNPPGQPFAYPPGELAFYGAVKLVTGSIFDADRVASMANLAVLALLSPIVGPALTALAVSVAALAQPLAFSAANGSNDTAASFLTVLAIALLATSRAVSQRPLRRTTFWAGAIAFGWAIAFKETTALVYVAVLAYLIRTHWNPRAFAVGSLGFAAALTLPFFFWNPAGFWHNVVGGLFLHQNIWGRNVWGLVTAVAPDARDAIAPFVPAIMLLALAVVAVACWQRPVRSLGGAVLQGCALMGTVFLFGRWTTWVYYVQIGAILLVGTVLALGEDERR
jgi:hypothetical protein